MTKIATIEKGQVLEIKEGIEATRNKGSYYERKLGYVLIFKKKGNHTLVWRVK